MRRTPTSRPAALGLLLVLIAWWAPSAAGENQITIVMPAAATYGPRPPTNPEELAYAELLAARWPTLRLDGTLTAAANGYARATIAAGTMDVDSAVLEALLLRSGCPDPGARAVVVSTTEDDVSDLLEALTSTVTSRPPPSHIGIARIPLQAASFRWRWVAITVVRQMQLTTQVPRRIAPDETLAIELRLAAGLAGPILVVQWPDGSTGRVEPRPTAGAEWLAVLPPAHQPGSLVVQVMATGEIGPQVVGTLAIEVAERAAEPADDRFTWRRDTELGADSGQAPTARLRALVNRLRVGHGLPALVADPRLDRIALDHTTELAQRGVLSHLSAAGGGLETRLQAADYRYSVALENLARAHDLEAAHASLTRSPSHRANLLSTEVSALGVGVVDVVSDDGSDEVFVTEVLTAPRRAPSGREGLSVARALLQQSARGGVPDPVLDGAAQTLAARPNIAELAPDLVLAQLRQQLANSGFAPQTVAFELAVTGTTAELEPPRSLGVLTAAQLGVGAAVVDSGDGPPRLQVVYLGTSPVAELR